MNEFIIATIFTIFASPSIATEIVCQVRDTGDGNGFISPVLAMQFDEGAKTALVSDSVIFHVYGAPIKAKLKDRGNGKYRITYRVNNIPARPNRVSMAYRLDLDTNDNSISVRGTMPASLNSTFGKGMCMDAKLTQ